MGFALSGRRDDLGLSGGEGELEMRLVEGSEDGEARRMLVLRALVGEDK